MASRLIKNIENVIKKLNKADRELLITRDKKPNPQINMTYLFGFIKA